MLSIIVPVYNAEKYLRECIDSVLLQQDFYDYELICVDDGSTDSSLNILRSYSDPRLKILTQGNQGAGVARNKAISVAKGDYIMFLDSDDLMADGQDIAQAYNYAIENNIDILLCGHNVIEENGSLICTVIPNFRILSNGYNNEKEIINKRKSYHPSEAGLGLFQLSYNGPCAKLYRRAFIIEHRLQFLTLKRSEDFPFVELSLAAAERIATLDKILFYRRQNVNASLENSKDETPLIFHEAETQLHTELKNRGLDTFIPAANLQAVIRLQYNLASMRSFKGFETLYEKLQDYYNEYHIAVPVTSPAYEAYSNASKIIEEAIGYGNAGDYLMAQLRKLNYDIYNKNKTIEYFKKQISTTNNRPIFRIYNSILNLFHKK